MCEARVSMDTDFKDRFSPYATVRRARPIGDGHRLFPASDLPVDLGCPDAEVLAITAFALAVL